MNEEQWLDSNVEALLKYVQGKTSNRKLRLFGCACYRRLFDLSFLPWEYRRRWYKRLYKVLEIAENYADKMVSVMELDSASQEMSQLGPRLRVTARNHFFRQIELAALETQRVIGRRIDDPNDPNSCPHLTEENSVTEVFDSKAQAPILRDIVGNPFQPVTIPPAWLRCNDAVVVRLAQAAYAKRILPAGTLDNTRLLILADALEEAGCTDEQILTHLRGGGKHYRGCWVIDLILSKDR